MAVLVSSATGRPLSVWPAATGGPFVDKVLLFLLTSSPWYRSGWCYAGAAALGILGAVGFGLRRARRGRVGAAAQDRTAAPEAQTFDPRKLVVSAAAIASAGTRDRRRVEFAVSPAVPGQLRGDAGIIQEILVQLVGQALKSAGLNPVCGTVWCQAGNPGTIQVLFAVFHDGPGGAGIVDGGTPWPERHQILAEKMGGSIWLEKEKDQGTCFTFSARFANAGDSAWPVAFRSPAPAAEFPVADPLVNLRLLAGKKRTPLDQELALFLADLDAEFTQLRGALQQEDRQNVGHYAHLLYGRFAFAGEPALELMVRKIAEAANAGRWPDARRLSGETGGALAAWRISLASAARVVPPG